TVLMRKSNVPTEISDKYSCPSVTVEGLKQEKNGVKIDIKKAEEINYKVFRAEKGNKILIFDSKKSGEREITDKNLKKNTEYEYSVIPYYENKNKIFYGKEISVGRIKTDGNLPENWWLND
ncbi:MAG: hypothetical protein MJ072_06260, partial [Clostridia bacterium]|nr:hypothetical protein [Clostridia bacterium]